MAFVHDIGLILTLTGGLAAALIAGYVTHRVGLSPIVGYLLAGVVVGPHTPGFVADRALAEQLAEIGVILLMFGVGLQFHVEELLAVRRVAVPGALGQSLVATVLGTCAALACGWGATAGLLFGLSVAVASTVVLVRVLSDQRELHTPVGHIAVGWLVVEDLFTVAVLVLMPALFGSTPGSASVIAISLLVALLKLGVVLALVFLLGGRVIPWLLGQAAQTRSRELFTLTILVVALGIAVGSAMLFGVSMALGAFLAGMVVGRSDFSLRAATEALPMRDAFAVLFFVSVGMLFDPHQLLAQPLAFLLTLAIVLLGKPLAALVIVRALGYPVRVGIAVAIALAQVGEFSFILAGLGARLGVLPQAANNAVIAAALVSIALNPMLFRLVGPLERWTQRRPRLWAWLSARVRDVAASAGDGPSAARTEAPRAVVVGHGPVGQTVTRLLRENGIAPTVIELNLDTVRRLRSAGVAAIYGDAAHDQTLREAGVQSARALILSASSLTEAREVIRLARELNPEVRILARANYVREQSALRRAGAEVVFSGEAEVGLAFTEAMLQTLGATPEQIDRERARVRAHFDDGNAAPG
jgi:CPA2 family monovalent cation:H+ antiporter-2